MVCFHRNFPYESSYYFVYQHIHIPAQDGVHGYSHLFYFHSITYLERSLIQQLAKQKHAGCSLCLQVCYLFSTTLFKEILVLFPSCTEVSVRTCLLHHLLLFRTSLTALVNLLLFCSLTLSFCVYLTDMGAYFCPEAVIPPLTEHIFGSSFDFFI